MVDLHRLVHSEDETPLTVFGKIHGGDKYDLRCKFCCCCEIIHQGIAGLQHIHALLF